MNHSFAIMVAVGIAIATPGAFAQSASEEAALHITAITDPPLDLFAEPKVGKPIRSYEAHEVTLPIAVFAVADNKMLRVKVNGIEGWVMPTFVETDRPVPKIAGTCDMAAGDVRVGATRGLGEGC